MNKSAELLVFIDESRQDVKKEESMIRLVLDRNTKGLFRDEFWTPYNKILTELDEREVNYVVIESKYDHDSEGAPSGKQWLLRIFSSTGKGGWHLRIVASFGPSKKGENDVYDLVAVLSWDAKIKENDNE